MAKQIAIDIDIKGTKDVIDLQKQIKETNKLLKQTEDVEAYDKLATDLVKLKSQLQEARRAQRQAVDSFKATDEGVGAYSRLSAQLRVARNSLKDLKASGVTTGEEVEKLTAEVNQLDTSLKDIDRSVGQTNREVGAYEEAVRKAVGITDAQTGAFTRLEGKAKVLRKAYKDVATESGKNSKEAKILKRELDKVEAQLKKVSNTADKAQKRFRSFKDSARGLGGAFGGIANAFIAFDALPGVIAGVQDFAEGLENVISFLSPAAALNRRFSESIQEGAVQLVNERIELDSNFAAAINAKEGTEARTEAIENLQTLYPSYLGDLDAETVSNQQLAIAQRSATSALLDDIAAQQTKAQSVKIFEEFGAAAAKNIEIQRESETVAGEIADGLIGGTTAVIDFFLGASGTFQGNLTDINTAINENTKENLKAQAEQLPEYQKELRKGFEEINGVLNKAGFDLAQEQANIAAQAAADREKRAADQVAREEAQAVKAAQRIAQKLATERARAIAKRREQQQSFEKSEIQAAQTRANILVGIERQIIQTELNAQEAGLQKSLALEEDSSNQKIAKLQENQQKFIDQANKQQAAVNKAFGEGSQRALEIEAQLATEKLKIDKGVNNAIEAEQAASLGRRATIAEDFAKQQESEATQALNKRLAELNTERQAVANAVNNELLEIRERRAKGSIDAIAADNEAFQARVANIKKQLETLNAQEVALIGLDIQVPQAEFDALISAQQNLNTQLAELEEQRTKKVEDEAAAQAAVRQKTIDQIGQGVGIAFDAINVVTEAANAAQIKRIETLQEERAKNLEGLNADLSKASGLEKAFLQQRINDEVKAQEDLARKKERIEKEQAIANKALALIQAIINTAVAVSAQLAIPGAGFALAALAGAIGAVEIATIAAQPLATGGVVGFKNGGRVSQGQNIATQPNGDNVLATLKRGEVVLNSGQQQRLGGAKTFRAAGVPGFQSGGIVSPPMSAPTLAQAGSQASNQNALILETREMVIELKNAVMRQEVVYTTNTETAIENDKKDRKEITQRATL